MTFVHPQKQYTLQNTPLHLPFNAITLRTARKAIINHDTKPIGSDCSNVTFINFCQVLFVMRSENDILIDIVKQIFRYAFFPLLAFGHFCYLFLFLSVLFLVIEHLLESEKIFPCLLVQLLVDVLVDGDEARHHHVLQGVDAAICHFDLLIKGEKGGLQGSDFDEQVQDSSKLLSAFLDGKASPFEADLAHGVFCVFELLEIEVGYEYTSDIFFRFIEANGGAFDCLCHFAAGCECWYVNYPAAYLASAMRKKASLHSSPIFFLLSSSSFMTYLNFFLRASALRFSSSWPFFAAAIFCLYSCMFLDRGRCTCDWQ